MAEIIYNIFLVYENDICASIDYVTHEITLDDGEAVAFLLSRVESDYGIAKKFRLGKPFTQSEYNSKCRLAAGHHLFDDFFVFACAGAKPLFVSTPVLDGQPFFNYRHKHDEPLYINAVSRKLGERGEMIDWLEKYTNADGINISQLIHDDYFLAIKLTYNARLYVSAMKLLVSCIDSLAYIEYGDDRASNPFINWLNTYANLAPLGIDGSELWELRNGILHMSNVNSNKVRTNKIRRISFRVGGPSDHSREDGDGTYYFDFYGLIQAFADAQGRWLASYNGDREKFAKFVERYDETISDSRLTLTILSPK